ncbi:MAG: hypothetical protein NTV34_12550 [Proteobacteria bacterium]|nr:hypothetical protein [Pseudomonadota bacterium]
MNGVMMYFRLASRSVIRHRRRYFISMLMIAGVHCSLVINSGHNIYADLHMQATAVYHSRQGHIMIYKPMGKLRTLDMSGQYLLNSEDESYLKSALQNDPDIETIGSYRIIPAMLSNGCKSFPVIVKGIDERIEYILQTHPVVKQRTPALFPGPFSSLTGFSRGTGTYPLLITHAISHSINKPLIFSNQKEAITAFIDCESAAANSVIESDPLVQLMIRPTPSELNVADFLVTGFFSTGNIFTEDLLVMTTNNDLAIGLQAQGSTYLGIYLNEHADLDRVLSKVKAKISSTGRQYDVVSSLSRQTNRLYDGIVKWFKAMDLFMLAIFGVLLTAIIMNFFILSTIERKPEIGVFRAIGFTVGFVRTLFLLEIIIVIGGGLCMGSILSIMGTGLVNSLKILYAPPGVPNQTFFLLTPNLGSHLLIGAAIGSVAIVGCLIGIIWNVRNDEILDQIRSRI